MSSPPSAWRRRYERAMLRRVGRTVQLGKLVRWVNLCTPQARVTEVPEQHQGRGDGVEAVQPPDRARRKARDVHPVDGVADIARHDVPEAVRLEVPRLR